MQESQYWPPQLIEIDVDDFLQSDLRQKFLSDPDEISLSRQL